MNRFALILTGSLFLVAACGDRDPVKPAGGATAKTSNDSAAQKAADAGMRARRKAEELRRAENQKTKETNESVNP